MRWAGHIAYMGRGVAYTWFEGGKLRERYHLEHPGIYGKIILRWIFRKLCRWAWTGLNWLRLGRVSGVV
jgi:hypothetical protein